MTYVLTTREGTSGRRRFNVDEGKTIFKVHGKPSDLSATPEVIVVFVEDFTPTVGQELSQAAYDTKIAEWGVLWDQR